MVEAVSFTLVSDANAASRIVVFQFHDGSGTSYAPVAAPFVQTASHTSRYTFAVGIQQFGANDAANIGAGIPPVRLDVGYGITVTIAAKQATDQVSAVALLLSQWAVRP